MLETPTATAVTAGSWHAMLARLDALPPDGWQRPTPCEGWDIEALVRHNIWGVSMEADAVRRSRSGAGGRADGTTAAAAAGPAELVAGLRSAVDDLLRELGAFVPEDESRIVPLAAADVPWPFAVTIFAFEAATHADDLAAALRSDGPRPELEPDAIRAAATFLEWFLPLTVPDGRVPAPVAGTSVRLVGDRGLVDIGLGYDGARWAPGQPAAAGVTIAGNDSDVLRVALGRLSAADPALRIDGDRAAALAIKSWLPGP